MDEIVLVIITAKASGGVHGQTELSKEGAEFKVQPLMWIRPKNPSGARGSAARQQLISDERLFD